MASITIDLVNRLFIETGTVGDGDTTYSVVDDFYLPWKALLRADFDNLGLPQAMRYVGLDPLTATQDLGASYFFVNRFRFKPGEWDHEVELVGNLWPDPFTNPLIVPTDGGYTVLVKQRVSNLVDSSVARLDLNQLLQSVYIDTVNGVAGTGTDVGTPTNPVNNIADAVTIANARNLFSFNINGSLTLDRNFSDWTFNGEGNHLTNNLALGGYDVDGCLFDRVNLSGTMSGRIEAINCGLNVLTGLDGVFNGCGMQDDFTLAASSNAVFTHCFSEVAGNNTINVTMGTNSAIQVRGYSGGIEIENFDATNNGSIDLDPGHLILNANCTGGALLVRGVGRLTRNDSDAVTLVEGGLVRGGLRTYLNYGDIIQEKE